MMEAEARTAVHRASADASIAVRDFEPSDVASWEHFVNRSSKSTFFHRIGWKQIIEQVFHHRTHYRIAERAGKVVGVLPLAEIRSWLFGHSLVSLPFGVYGGPAADDSEVDHALAEAAVALARSLGVQHLEMRNRIAKWPHWPRQDIYVTFRKNLLQDVEANLLAVPRKQRAMIRKGMKQGLRSEVDATVDRFFDLYADNVHRHGTPPFSKRYFSTLCEVFGESCEVMTVVDGNGRPVSSVMSFYFKDEILPYYAGDTSAARDLAANDFKYWELMRRACERGVRVFDYGRSKRGTGSFDFKKNWGFHPEPLHYEYRLCRGEAIPQNNPLNPKYRALIAVWKRLPGSVANAFGPHIVRYLG